MSLRSLIRLLALGLVCLLLAIPLWDVAGGWFLLVGPGLLLLVLGYLLLAAGRPPLSRWQLRYYLPEGDGSDGQSAGPDHLTEVLLYAQNFERDHYAFDAESDFVGEAAGSSRNRPRALPSTTR